MLGWLIGGAYRDAIGANLDPAGSIMHGDAGIDVVAGPVLDPQHLEAILAA